MDRLEKRLCDQTDKQEKQNLTFVNVFAFIKNYIRYLTKCSLKKCPHCNSTKRSRRQRKLLLKYIPYSKAYACGTCSTRYLYIIPFNISIKIKKAFY